MNAHDDENPMWTRLEALSPDADAAGLACRIALPAPSMAALIGADVPGDRIARFPTWDAPHTLLADDEALADAVRALGVPIARPVAPYAVRQWDEREALEGAMHRFRDHDERPWGMTAFEPRVGVVLALGAATVRELLGRLVREVAPCGLVIDARAPRDLHVFALDVLARGRVIVATPAGVEELGREDLDRLLRDL